MLTNNLMNPDSIMFELDSAHDFGSFYPLIEPCIIIGQRMTTFGDLHFGMYIEAIMIAVVQNKLGVIKGGVSLVSTSYSNIQKAKMIVEKSIQNN